MKRFVLFLWIAIATVPSGSWGVVRAAGADVVQRGPERRHRGYVKDDWSVWYRGRKVEGAVASSFSDLGGGYGKDAWTVFYGGRKMEGAAASSFAVLGGGYGKDSWSVWFRGCKIEGLFESLGRGYAKDAWRVYYRGEAIPGVSPGSFRMPRR